MKGLWWVKQDVGRREGEVVVEEEGEDDDIPDTLTFINWEAKGNRFQGKNVVVFGGSSGIGFATAASFVQECGRVALVARNFMQLELALVQLSKLDVSHCDNLSGPSAAAVTADVSNRSQVRHALEEIGPFFEGKIDVVLNTAGHAGFIGKGIGQVPEEIFFSKFDAIQNNLYGAIFVVAESLRFLNITEDEEAQGPPEDFAIVTLASEEGLQPCPSCAMYGISKSGIIELSRSIALMYEENNLRSYVVAPGLVNTPMTWNQIRGTRIGKDGSLVQVDQLQMYQCYEKNTSRVIKDGTCPWGGTGYGCPCPDERVSDPRLPLKYGPHLWPPIDPRQLSSLILFLASNDGKGWSGQTFVVDNNYTRVNSTHHVVRSCPSSMTSFCPLVHLTEQDADTSVGGWLGELSWPHFPSLLLGMLLMMLVSRFPPLSPPRQSSKQPLLQ